MIPIFSIESIGGDEVAVHEIVENMFIYIDKWVGKGFKLHKITRHMLQLFAGKPGSRAWKQHITQNSCRFGVGSEAVREALAKVPG